METQALHTAATVPKARFRIEDPFSVGRNSLCHRCAVRQESTAHTLQLQAASPPLASSTVAENLAQADQPQYLIARFLDGSPAQ
jgi:hypothetical protein